MEVTWDFGSHVTQALADGGDDHEARLCVFFDMLLRKSISNNTW